MCSEKEQFGFSLIIHSDNSEKNLKQLLPWKDERGFKYLNKGDKLKNEKETFKLWQENIISILSSSYAYDLLGVCST